MLKSCSYCGRIHDEKFNCPKKPKYSKYKKQTKSNEFRKTNIWKEKSKKIRERDNYICQICLRELYNTHQKYNHQNIQVHHIVPVVEDYELRVDDENLISLCKYHHDIAEEGKISREELKNIAKEQEEKYINNSTPLL